jgi:integrase
MNPVAGLMPTQLTLREHQGINFYMFEGLPVLKRREVLNDRRVPVSPKDNDVVQIVLDYVRDRNPREPIFPFDRVRAWVRLSHAFGKKEKDKLDEFNFYCHYFRHVCMNLKVDEEGFEALQLQTFARWANIKHTTTYLEGSPAIIVDKLINNYKDSLLRKP